MSEQPRNSESARDESVAAAPDAGSRPPDKAAEPVGETTIAAHTPPSSGQTSSPVGPPPPVGPAPFGPPPPGSGPGRGGWGRGGWGGSGRRGRPSGRLIAAAAAAAVIIGCLCGGIGVAVGAAVDDPRCLVSSDRCDGDGRGNGPAIRVKRQGGGDGERADTNRHGDNPGTRRGHGDRRQSTADRATPGQSTPGQSPSASPTS